MERTLINAALATLRGPCQLTCDLALPDVLNKPVNSSVRKIQKVHNGCIYT